MKKVLIVTLGVLLVLALVLTFVFSNSNQEQIPANDSLTKVKVSEVTHSVFYAPQYVAINKGLFEKNGIEIELINSQGADKVMTAVLAGQADVGFSGPEASIYIYLQGKEDYAQVFAQLTKRDGSFLVGRNNEENFSWTNLKNKHILPGRKGGVPYMTLEYVIKQNGLNPETDMNFDNSISFDAMTSAFLSGVGDYVTIFEPTATVIENEGKGFIVASVGEASGEIPYTAYFAKKSYIETNKDTIQKFVNSIQEAQTWVNSHSAREVAEAILPSFADTDIEVLEKVVQRYKDIDAWNQTPYMTEESFNKLQEVMIEAGELTNIAPYNEIVNNNFVK